jgi:hypothetical protein
MYLFTHTFPTLSTMWNTLFMRCSPDLQFMYIIGDSGSPAVYEDKLVGVANFIISDCGTLFPDGFLKVSDYLGWINSSMEKYNDVMRPIYI